MPHASSTISKNRVNIKSFNPKEYICEGICPQKTQTSHTNTPKRYHTYVYTVDEQMLIIKTFRQGRPVWIYDLKQETWIMLDPNDLPQFDFHNKLYSICRPKEQPANRENRLESDIAVFPPTHVQHKRIVYDPVEREYYDKTNDMFLTEDDINFYGLKPYSQITAPLPNPLPENYWDAKPE